MDTIRIFVGSSREDQTAGAETVLEHSVRIHTSHPVEFVWMRSGDPGWRVGPKAEVGPQGDLSWNIGRSASRPPWIPAYRIGTSHPWWTGFSDFRWAIPEFAGFKGKALYFDVDMYAKADVAEMWNWPLRKPWVTTVVGQKFRVEASVIDCAYFEKQTWWPRIEAMKKGQRRKFLVNELQKHDVVACDMPKLWNIMDRWREDAKVQHFTNVRTQVWRPQEANMPADWYQRHPDERLANEWFDLYTEATGKTHKHDVRVRA